MRIPESMPFVGDCGEDLVKYEQKTGIERDIIKGANEKLSFIVEDITSEFAPAYKSFHAGYNVNGPLWLFM